MHEAAIVSLKSIYDLGAPAWSQYQSAYKDFETDYANSDLEYPLIYVHIANPESPTYPVYNGSDNCCKDSEEDESTCEKV